MCLVPTAFTGDVAAEWQTAYQGCIAASLSQGGQLLQELLEPGLRGGYQVTCNVPFPIPIPLQFSWKPILVTTQYP